MLFPWSPCFSYSLAQDMRNSCSLKTIFGRLHKETVLLTIRQRKASKQAQKLNVEVFGPLKIPILTYVCKSIMAMIWIFPKLTTKCMTTLIWTVVVPSFSVFCWCHSLLSPRRTFMNEYFDFFSFFNLLLCTSKWWKEIMKKREGEIKLKRL